MANIPIPENDDSLELNVRYQPDMVLEGMLDATVPEMKYLRLSQGNETHDLLGAQSGDQILELLSEDLTAADNGKVLTAVYGGIEGEETGSVVWAKPRGGNLITISNSFQSALVSAMQTAIAACATSSFQTSVEIASTSDVLASDFLALKNALFKAKAGEVSYVQIGTDLVEVAFFSGNVSDDETGSVVTTVIMPEYLLIHPQIGNHFMRITLHLTTSAVYDDTVYKVTCNYIVIVEHLAQEP